MSNTEVKEHTEITFRDLGRHLPSSRNCTRIRGTTMSTMSYQSNSEIPNTKWEADICEYSVGKLQHIQPIFGASKYKKKWVVILKRVTPIVSISIHH